MLAFLLNLELLWQTLLCCSGVRRFKFNSTFSEFWSGRSTPPRLMEHWKFPKPSRRKILRVYLEDFLLTGLNSHGLCLERSNRDRIWRLKIRHIVEVWICSRISHSGSVRRWEQVLHFGLAHFSRSSLHFRYFTWCWQDKNVLQGLVTFLTTQVSLGLKVVLRFRFFRFLWC